MYSLYRVTCLYLSCLSLLLSLVFSQHVLADNNTWVNITTTIPYVEVMHKGKTVRIQRIQANANIIDLDFALTSRPCPPYCIQPIKLEPGIETIGELGVLSYLKKAAKDEPVLVIDSREPRWLRKGMIPGAINIPWTVLYNKTASDEEIVNILQLHFNVVNTGKLFNFQNAKTLVFYCNGPWCGQSSTSIRALLSLGYPAHRIKWYRGGIQSWLQFGLTTVSQ